MAVQDRSRGTYTLNTALQQPSKIHPSAYSPRAVILLKLFAGNHQSASLPPQCRGGAFVSPSRRRRRVGGRCRKELTRVLTGNAPSSFLLINDSIEKFPVVEFLNTRISIRTKSRRNLSSGVRSVDSITLLDVRN